MDCFHLRVACASGFAPWRDDRVTMAFFLRFRRSYLKLRRVWKKLRQAANFVSGAIRNALGAGGTPTRASILNDLAGINKREFLSNPASWIGSRCG